MDDSSRKDPDELIQTYFDAEKSRPAAPLSPSRLARARISAESRRKESAPIWKIGISAAVAALVLAIVVPRQKDVPLEALADDFGWVWDIENGTASETTDPLARLDTEIAALEAALGYRAPATGDNPSSLDWLLLAEPG